MRHLILPLHRSNTHEFHATLIFMNINILLGANILLGGGINATSKLFSYLDIEGTATAGLHPSYNKEGTVNLNNKR